MKTLTIRGIDQELSERIRSLAKENHESINQSILRILKTALGLTHSPQFKTYDDLDHLAGGWSQQDKKRFIEATVSIRKIDKELWS